MNGLCVLHGEGCMTNFNSTLNYSQSALITCVSVTSGDRDEAHTVSFSIWRFARVYYS